MGDHDNLEFFTNSANAFSSVSSCPTNRAFNNKNIKKSDVVRSTVAKPVAMHATCQTDWSQPKSQPKSLKQNACFSKRLQRKNYGVWVPVKPHRRCIKSCMTHDRRRMMATQTTQEVTQVEEANQGDAMNNADLHRAGMADLANCHPTLIETENNQFTETEPQNGTLTTLNLLDNMYAANNVDTEELLNILLMFPGFCEQTANTVVAIDEMKASMRTLMDLFHIPTEMDFLVYRVLKDNLGNLEQTSAAIAEALYELRSWKQLQEALIGVDSVDDNTTL